MPEVIRERAIRLFQYLRELMLLRYPTVYSLDAYEDVLWFADVPHEPECSCATWNRAPGAEPPEEYLEISKPDMSTPPSLPEELSGWLDESRIGDSSQDMPTLLDSKVVPGDRDQPDVLKLSDHPYIKSKWEQYVEKEWWPWAEEDRRLKEVQKLYTKLFTMYQQQQQVGGRYEVVLAIGCLSWRAPKRLPDGQDINIERHLVVAQLELKFDAQRGIMSVVPAADGAKARLEQEMLDARPAAGVQDSVEQQLADAGNYLLGNEDVLGALKEWHNAFDASATGRFDASINPAEGFPHGPALHYAPAIILRRRTATGLIRTFEHIVKALTDGGPVPNGIKQVVTIEERPEGAVTSDDRPLPDSLLFPLPANEEQERIAHLLSRNCNVLVHGPPGTGKSHTIANLITDLLAHGKRVLVTSHGPQALTVLKNKLVEAGAAELCVFLLGNDTAAKDSLKKSVDSIAGHYNTWDEVRNTREIESLQKDLERARSDEASAVQETIKARERESYQHGPLPGGYQGTAQRIATQVADESPTFGWLPDDANPETDAPLTDVEAQELLGLLRSTDEPNEEDLTAPAIDTHTLPSPAEFDSAVRAEREAAERFSELEPCTSHPAYAALVQASADDRVSLSGALRQMQECVQTSSASPHGWVKGAVTDILSQRAGRWQKLHDFTRDQLAVQQTVTAEVLDADVAGVGERELATVSADAQALLSYLQDGHGLGFWPFRSRTVSSRKHVLRLRVNGKYCRDASTLGVLSTWLELRIAVSKLDEHWQSIASVQQGPLRLRLASYRDLHALLGTVLALSGMVDEVRTALRPLSVRWEPAWHDPAELTSLGSTLGAAESQLALRAQRRWFGEIEKRLRNAAAENQERTLIRRLADSVDAREATGYADAVAVLQRLYESRERLRRRVELLSRLRNTTPRLAGTLESDYDDEVWDGRMSAFQRAWNWARTEGWLTRLDDQGEYQRLLTRLDACRSRVLEIKKRLAVAKAWRECLGTERLPEQVRMELMLWSDEDRKVLKGKGKHAELHRRKAQKHLDKCRPAIPAWVMPIHRVAESVTPAPDAFDVAIIDEASQSGPECLFLQYIARQVVVVGDPDQISPDEIGVPRTAVEQLKQRYVSDVATRDAIEPDTSYFGLATVLCRNVIRLREHFRCMPEIIRFSNDLCYATNPLIPLKQHGAGRLEPPVIARHVPDGCLEGEGQRTTNLPEAQAVVDQIVKCLGDEAYANKTLGVISLLGHSQSRLIDRLLKSRVDAEGIQKRQLICGEPYAFQGDERDVIFLSMVSAVSEGRRIGPLSNDRYKRAFNVAASRAKEQMWLFHSVTLNDLSQTCYRYRLLQFFLGDAARPAPGPMPDEKLRDLAVLAQSTARNGEDAPEPFDSWFEVDVYLELAKRGYRVLPQFEVADYHIDLMVVGLDRRLAVECDGDACHGPDRLEADLFRQRMLERCGEEFWRVRGSDFYRDRERAVRELLDRLDRMDIVPVQREAELRARRRERQASSVQPTASPFAAHQPEEVPVRQAKPAAPAGFVEYRCWPVKDVPDPRTAPVSEVADALYRIVVAEGPVTDGRAYSLYAKGARLGRVARIARRALDSGLGRLMRLGKVDVYFEEPPRSKKELVIVAKDAPKAVVRTLGGRTLDEVPLSELASVIHGLEQKGYREDAPLFRRVLELYGRVALTHAATARLRAARCLGLDGGPVAPPDADCPLQGHFDL